MLWRDGGDKVLTAFEKDVILNKAYKPETTLLILKTGITDCWELLA